MREQAVLEFSCRRAKTKDTEKDKAYSFRGQWISSIKSFSHLYHIWKDIIFDAEEAVLRGDV